MKVLLVHNAYGVFSGEEAVVRDIRGLLLAQGHKVLSFERSSTEIGFMRFGSLKAFLSGIYNPWSRRRFRDFIKETKPDIIHIHNLFPLISPSILAEAKKANLPVVMTVHNYRLICPTGLHFSHGEICERCSGGQEQHCILHNCENSIVKSAGYAMRNWWARKQRYYLDNVSMFACLTEFQKKRLVSAGFEAERMEILPNMVQTPIASDAMDGGGEYVGYVGRLSPEKGISVLVHAARLCRDVPFTAAGAYDRMADLSSQVPENFTLLGHCDRRALADFYSKAKIIVLPSVCFEGFPTILVEAMLLGKPIICSNIGGLPEIVDDEVTGLLVKPGDADELAQKIRYLWNNPELCMRMGEAGREKALREYSEGRYYKRLMDIYQEAIAVCNS